MASRFDGVLRVLEEQGWTVEKTKSNRFSARPPDAALKIVVFAVPANDGSPTVFNNVIRELRHSGFVWPPPPREKPSPVLRSVPFPPAPNPDAETVTGAGAAPRERDFVTLAAGEVRLAKAALEVATARLRESTETYDGAVQDYRAKKVAFDAEFEIADPLSGEGLGVAASSTP